MTLAVEQQWMQDFIVDPRGDAVVRTQAEAEAGRAILPSASLTAIDRLQIYRDMYLLRMEEALASDYPALQRFLGNKTFATLVGQYVERWPSRSYTMNRLGRHLPAFIQEVPTLRRRAFCHDLARLEQAVTETFDAPRSELLREETLRSVEAWDRVRLVPIRALQLLAFDYPVHDYLEAVQTEARLPSTKRRPSWVAVYRPWHSMHRLPLDREQYRLLTAIVAGVPLYEAFTQTGRIPSAEWFSWVQKWVGAGLFSQLAVVETP